MEPSEYKDDLDKAQKIVKDQGCIGWIVKLFFGKKKTSTFNNLFDQANAQLTNQSKYQSVIQSGTSATAIVQKIEDTGMLINFNPVVKLSLRVKPVDAYEYEVTIQTPVSKINIPRVNDEINVKYNPSNPAEVVIIL